MALEPMVYVWTTPYSGAKKLMLMAIANRCDEHGVCWPSVEMFAKKCCVTVRAAQMSIRQLEEDGEIVIFYNAGIETSHGYTNLYYMKNYRASIGLNMPTVDEVKKTSPVKEYLENGVKKASRQGVKNLSGQGMKKTSPNTKEYKQEDTQERKETTHVSVDMDRVSSTETNSVKPVSLKTSENSAPAEKVKTGKGKAKDTTAPLTPIATAPFPIAVEASLLAANDSPIEEKTAKERKPNPMAQLIDKMWGRAVSGPLLPMLMGNAKRDPWAKYNIEDGMTSIEIVAFARWYRSAYPLVKIFPSDAAKVWGHVTSFRDSVDYERWMKEGEKMLPHYQPKEAPAPVTEDRSTPEEIAAWKKNLVDQGLTEGFGDLFDDYKTQEHVS